MLSVDQRPTNPFALVETISPPPGSPPELNWCLHGDGRISFSGVLFGRQRMIVGQNAEDLVNMAVLMSQGKA